MQDSMPYWQDVPCPPWCAIEHTATDHIEDRVHRPDQDLVMVTLTVNDPVHCRRPDGSGCFLPPVLRVDLEQHDRERAPRIVLTEKNSASYHLTPTEAVDIGSALIKAGQLAGETR